MIAANKLKESLDDDPRVRDLTHEVAEAERAFAQHATRDNGLRWRILKCMLGALLDERRAQNERVLALRDMCKRMAAIAEAEEFSRLQAIRAAAGLAPKFTSMPPLRDEEDHWRPGDVEIGRALHVWQSL
jgi:hypothetical protein